MTTNVTVRADDDLIAALEEEADSLGRSRAEHIRHLLRTRNESDDRVDELERTNNELEAHVDELETELDRVHRQSRQILDQREEHSELVAAVERDRSLAERKARAGLGTKLKWALFGMKEDE